MSAETFVEADIWTIAQTDQGNVVLVRPKGSDLAVPIIIGQLETQSILIGMGGVEVPRPLTHDLAVSLLKALSATLLRIEINDLQEGTFYARLVLRQAGEEIVVDARPSDAIGIAVRSGCPVFISEAVVDEAGISVNLVTEAGHAEGSGTAAAGGGTADGTAGEAPAEDESPPNGELSHFRPGRKVRSEAQDEELRRLKEELEEAIAVENYERAAFLRDRLRELGG
jgi:hypothetical protein